MRKGDLYTADRRETVMYLGIVVDNEGTWYLIQKTYCKPERVSIQYFEEWYRPVYQYREVQK